MLAERLERNWVVDFSSAFAGIVQGDEVGGFQGFLSDWIGVIVLSNFVALMMRDILNNIHKTHFNQGMMFTKSNTSPLPSEFLAQTGWLNGWKDSAQQSNGVREPGCGASDFLQPKSVRRGALVVKVHTL